MKPSRILALTICAAVLCGGIAACGEKESASSSAASSMSSSMDSAPSASSVVESTAGSAQSANTSSAASSAPESHAETNEGGAITPGPASEETSAPQTAFDKKWAENPLDAAYEKDSESADTMQEMVSLANTYAVQWQSAVIDAYQKLLTASGNDPQIEQEQAAWETQENAFLQDLAEGTQAGTSDALSAATQKMEFYRSRAKALYEKLYAYDPNFTYDQTE